MDENAIHQLLGMIQSNIKNLCRSMDEMREDNKNRNKWCNEHIAPAVKKNSEFIEKFEKGRYFEEIEANSRHRKTHVWLIVTFVGALVINFGKYAFEHLTVEHRPKLIRYELDDNKELYASRRSDAR